MPSRGIPVKVKRLHRDAVIPDYASSGSVSFDLTAVENTIIQPDETMLIRTGLAFQIPEGYEMQIRMRSGIAKRTPLRLANGIGTIDSDYRGEVLIILDNISRWYGKE